MMKYPAAKLVFTFPQKGKQALGVFRLITKVLLSILLKQMHLAAFLCVDKSHAHPNHSDLPVTLIASQFTLRNS